MTKMLAVIAIVLASAQARADCHTNITVDDTQFFDKVLVQSVAASTWTGTAASQLAFLAVTERRVQFFGIGSVEQPVPMSAAELELYDAIVLSSLEKSSFNTSGEGGRWVSIPNEAQWAVGIAWDAMWARMTTRC